mgnify:CR=1 FL=1
MAEGTEKKSLLSKVFNAETLGKVALFGLSTAFGFAVMGALDFTLFHELVEGQLFMSAVQPLATDILRTEFMGVSVAGAFVNAAEYLHTAYPAAPLDAAAEAAAATAQNSLGGGMF